MARSGDGDRALPARLASNPLTQQSYLTNSHPSPCGTNRQRTREESRSMRPG
jgi:hypothetical protein